MWLLLELIIVDGLSLKFLRNNFEYLRSLSFTWQQISELIGVSYITIYRRRQEFGMVEPPRVGNVTDEQLLQVVSDLKRQSPSLGQTMVWGQGTLEVSRNKSDTFAK